MLKSLPLRSKGSIATDEVRIAIARDLHDGIAQELVALGFSLDALIARPDLTPELRSELRRSRLRLLTLLEQVRRELFELRTPATGSLTREIRDLAQRLAPEFLIEYAIDECTVSSEIFHCVKDVLGELVRNAARHSHGSSLWIQLTASPHHLELTVRDDGNGKARISSDRFGLVGVHERVTQLGGGLHILGNLGSTITITLPLSAL